MKRPTESTARSLVFLILFINNTWLSVGAVTQEILRGFIATPDPPVSSFQPLLQNPNGTFSLGFLRNGNSNLALAIVHDPSCEPVWLAHPTRWARWSKSTTLFFNGSLVLSDPHTGVLWSTHTDGDRLLILKYGNLQIQKFNDLNSVIWQSFDFPSDTLLDGQNFTVNASLVSSNGLYSMRLGEDFIGLYSKFKGKLGQIYWRHRALEAKASIVQGKPIYARVSPNGFLGMYQTEAAPVDVQSFNTFQRQISGIRRLRLEPDGNLRGYYWYNSKWVPDFQAIDDRCELPYACGSYGLCLPGGSCTCLDNRTEYSSSGCFPPESGDLCPVGGEDNVTDYWILRRAGLDLPDEELIGFQKMGSLEECENYCKTNCSCWGAVFHNVSGFCYGLNYPISTLLGSGDASKIGYFKVRRIKEEKKITGLGLADGKALLVGAVLVFVGVGVAGFGTCRIWRRKKTGHSIFMEKQVLSHGSYRELLRSSSFGAVELCKR